MEKIWKFLKEEKIILAVILAFFFFLIGYIYNVKGGNINLGSLILPLDRTIDWDPKKSTFVENNLPGENGYIVIIRNSADETLTTELNASNILNLKNILTYNFGTNDKVLKYADFNGYKHQTRIKIEALQISKDSELPIVLLSDQIDPVQMPKVTHSTKIISRASIFTLFDKMLWFGIVFMLGMITNWLFPFFLSGLKGIVILGNLIKAEHKQKAQSL